MEARRLPPAPFDGTVLGGPWPYNGSVTDVAPSDGEAGASTGGLGDPNTALNVASLDANGDDHYSVISTLPGSSRVLVVDASDMSVLADYVIVALDGFTSYVFLDGDPLASVPDLTGLSLLITFFGP